MKRLLTALLILLVLPGARLYDDSASDNLVVSSAIVSGPPLTVCAFAKTDDDTDGFQMIFGLGQTGVDENFRMRTDPSIDELECETDGAAGSGQATTTATDAMATGTVFHVCCVWASTTSRTAYINGANKVNNTASAAPTGLDTTWIGRLDDGSPGDDFSGTIDVVCAYDAALSDSDIASLSVGVNCDQLQRANLIGYWHQDGQSPERNIMNPTFNMTVNGTTVVPGLGKLWGRHVKAP
jgi:hypothetical protein